MTLSTKNPSRRADVSSDEVASDQTTASKLRDIVDDIDAVRHLIRAAQTAASSNDFHSDCGLTTLLDVIQEKLTAAGEELEMACRQNKEPANV